MKRSVAVPIPIPIPIPMVLLLVILAAVGACDIEDTTEPEDATPVIIASPPSGSVEQGIPLELSWRLDPRFTWADSAVVCCDTTANPLVEVYAGTDTSCTIAEYWPSMRSMLR